ncbi:hypothetical protein HK098_004768 [Nowakowskiella sp. JEL0407]|nr:hypothetical protein HK098_004768 [Nowakowskiella sp. JEL0407]
MSVSRAGTIKKGTRQPSQIPTTWDYETTDVHYATIRRPKSIAAPKPNFISGIIGKVKSPKQQNFESVANITNEDDSESVVLGEYGTNTGFSRRQSMMSMKSRITNIGHAAPALEESNLTEMNASMFAANSILDAKNLGDDELQNVRVDANGEIVLDEKVVPEEVILRMLSDYEDGYSLMLDRVKQSIYSCKEASIFLKKRAAIEEEYSKSLQKLAQTSIPNYSPKSPEGKEGTYLASWVGFCKIHERIAQVHLELSRRSNQYSEELLALCKNCDRSRKQLKEQGTKNWKAVQESEIALEKCKTKYEQSSEEWEKSMKLRDASEADSHSNTLDSRRGVNSSGGMAGLLSFKSHPNPAKLIKLEDDARTKAAIANENYKVQLQKTNTIRNDYFQIHLLRLLKMLKETNDECDSGTQSYLLKYAKELENSLLCEANTLRPQNNLAAGIYPALKSINSGLDFEKFVFTYIQDSKQHTKNDHEYHQRKNTAGELLVLKSSSSQPRRSFGVGLQEQCERDETHIPLVVSLCIKAIEEGGGFNCDGLYRVPGTNTIVQNMRAKVDRDVSVNLVELAQGDINNIASLLKLFFRELPDPLIPRETYYNFVNASKLKDEKLMIPTVHELINNLPDCNYATLQALVSHLIKVHKNEKTTKMTIENLSIVWGPTLLDPPIPNGGNSNVSTSSDPNDMTYQRNIVNVILSNANVIFDLSES